MCVCVWGGGGGGGRGHVSDDADYQWQKCGLKVGSRLVFCSQIILQRKLLTSWFVAQTVFSNFSGISARTELGRGTKELTCHGTEEAGGLIY